MAKYKEFLGKTFDTVEFKVNTSGDDKSGYYPTPGKVSLILREIPHEPGNPDQPAVQIIKGDVVAGRRVWEGAEAFEDAHFYIHDDLLVSDPIPVRVDENGGVRLSFTEVIEFEKKNKVLAMRHRLYWSDGDFGEWSCNDGGG